MGIEADDAMAGGCVVAMFAIFAAAGIGWILNIVKIFATVADPLGCVAGWL